VRPVLLLALFAASSNGYTPTLPGGIIAWLVCNGRKKHELGGWLLFFYWQVYSGIVLTLVFFSMNFQSYVPDNFVSGDGLPS
jgi:Na+/proline symporter